jgi:hypothetical protein
LRHFLSKIEYLPRQARDKHRRNSKKTRFSRYALSTGPFGIADKAGRTNLTIVNRAVRKDGLVIQPDRPASYIDAMFDDTTTIGRSIWSGTLRKRLFSAILYQKPNIRQDRLGTNIGETQKRDPLSYRQYWAAPSEWTHLGDLGGGQLHCWLRRRW